MVLRDLGRLRIMNNGDDRGSWDVGLGSEYGVSRSLFSASLTRLLMFMFIFDLFLFSVFLLK